MALLVGHIGLVRLHGVTEMHFENETPEEKKSFKFFPDHFLTELAVGLVLMVVLTSLACIFPAQLAAPANPLVTPEHIKPEWYFLFTFRWLKLTSISFAVLSLGLFGFLMMVWPWIDGYWRKKHPQSEMSVWVGSVVFIGVLILTLWEALAAH